MQENYLTSYQAAALIEVPYQKFLMMVKQGEIKPLTRLNGNAFVFDKNALLGNDGEPLPMIYGIKDIMARLGKCKNTVWNYVMQGKLKPSVKFVSIKGKGFQFGFTESDIRNFQASFVPKFEY